MFKIAEIRKKNKSELQALLTRQRKKLWELRFNLISGKVKNIREIRHLRKDIARILTILSQKSRISPR